MKKVIIFLIIVFGLILIPLKANSNIQNNILICEEGIGSDDDLILDNSLIVSDEVNWNQVGDYEVIYLNQENGMYFTRLVKITSKSQLDEGISLYLERVRTTNKDKYHVKDFLEITKYHYFLVGTAESTKRISGMDFTSECAFIQYYENNTLQWEKLFEDYSEIKAIKKSDKGIMILMAFYNGQESDLKLLEMNTKGKIEREKVIHGNDYEYAKDLLIVKDKIYIFATSYSTDGDIKDATRHQFVGVIKLNYSDFEIEDQIALGNSGYNNFIDFEYDDYLDVIWVMLEANGSYGKLVTKSGGFNGSFLICLDTNLSMIKCHHINVMGDPEFFYVDGYELIIFYTSIYDNCKFIHANVYTDEFNYKKSYMWGNIENEFSIKPIKVKQREINKYVIMYNKRMSGKLTFGGLIVFGKEVKTYPYQGEDSGILGYVNDDNSIYIVGENDSDVSITEYINVKANAISSEIYEHETYQSDYYTVNYKEVFDVGKTRTKEIFGDYEDRYNLNLPFISLIVSDKYYVKEKINVEEGQVYDVGTILEFNGKGYLNDQEIDSGYQIKEEGSYTLIVVGMNARKVLNFTVKALTIEGTPTPIETIEIEDLEVGKKKEHEEQIIEITTDLNPHTNQSGTIYSVVLASLLVLIGLIVPVKRRKK